MTHTRKPGRPRDATIDAEIVRALFGCTEEVGLGSVTIDAIAERAGVSKASIYRRWESKEDLIVDAIAGLVNVEAVPSESEGIRDVMLAALDRIRRFMSKSTAGSVFPWLVGEIASGSEIGRRYAEAVILPGRRAMIERVSAAIESGELRPDLDPELAADMLTGPVIITKLMGKYRQPGDDWSEQLVDALLEGWRA